MAGLMLLIGFHLGGFRRKANKSVTTIFRHAANAVVFQFGSVFVMITEMFCSDCKYGTRFFCKYKPKRSKSPQSDACAFKGEVHKLTLSAVT